LRPVLYDKILDNHPKLCVDVTLVTRPHKENVTQQLASRLELLAKLQEQLAALQEQLALFSGVLYAEQRVT